MATGCFSTKSWRLSRRHGRINSPRTCLWSCPLGTTWRPGKTCEVYTDCIDKNPMTTTLDGGHLISRETDRLGRAVTNAAQICPNAFVHWELGLEFNILKLATTPDSKILHETTYNQAKQASGTTFIICDSTTLLNVRSDTAVTCVSIRLVRLDRRADLSSQPYRCRRSSARTEQPKFFCTLRANGVPGKLSPVIPNRK